MNTHTQGLRDRSLSSRFWRPEVQGLGVPGLGRGEGESQQPGPVLLSLVPVSLLSPLRTLTGFRSHPNSICKPHFQIRSKEDMAGVHSSLGGWGPVPVPSDPIPGSDPTCPRVRTFPRDSPLGRDTVRALMHYALKVWSDITPLNFHEVAGSTADIQIDFSTADHNDRYPFDGPGGTVAHAFFPGDHHTAGDTHFDDDEAWTFRSSGASGLAGAQAGPRDPV